MPTTFWNRVQGVSGHSLLALPLTIHDPAHTRVLPKIMESTGVRALVPGAVWALQVADTKIELEVQEIGGGQCVRRLSGGGGGEEGG